MWMNVRALLKPGVKTIMIVANFWVHGHGVEDDGTHNYLLHGMQNDSNEDCGIEYDLSYSGPKLPVDDNKKFYARIIASCEDTIGEDEVQTNQMLLIYEKYMRACQVVSISFD